MRSFFFFVWSLAFGTGLSEAQVLTRHLDAKDDYQLYVPFAVDDEVMYYTQPIVDFAAVLAEDLRIGRPTERAAVRVARDYGVADGVWTPYGSASVWQLGISAPLASSINMILRDVVLPEGAELYVVSRDERIVHGPITAAVVYDGVYATDMIDASAVKLVAFVPEAGYKDFRLRVASVNQGLKRTPVISTPKDMQSGRWQDAADCHFDVNCAEGAGWEDERDAVAMILLNGDGLCTATLVNDQCQSFRPYMLTAFHCLDINTQNGTIDADEEILTTWSFRFKYESSSPSCPGNSTGSQGTWVTYSGATLRAANRSTDMALIELRGFILDQSQLAVAGWTRVNPTTTTTNTTVISHPRGDAKKIAFGQATPQASAFPNFGTVRTWVIPITTGGLQRASSGSAFFDQNRRVYAQLLGRIGSDVPCDITTEFHGGRFDLSWTGGGTDETRLSNWLAGQNPPMTTNTVRVPWVSPAANPSGTREVCTSNKSFTLQNVPPGATVVWSVSNTGLLATSGGAGHSGSSPTATLRAAGSNSNGAATLTFTIIQPTCANVTLAVPIWVGRPGTPVTNPSGTSPTNIGISQYHTVYLYDSRGATNKSGTWSASGAVSKVTNDNPSVAATYVGNYKGTGNWLLATTNGCGTRSYAGQYKVGHLSCNPCPKIGVNDPVYSDLTVRVLTDEFDDDYSGKPASPPLARATPAIGVEETTVDLVDQSGRSVLRYAFVGASGTQDVSALPAGLYFAKVAGAFGQETAKVVIVR